MPREPIKIASETSLLDGLTDKTLHPIEIWWKLLFSIDDGNLRAFQIILERIQDVNSLRLGPNKDHLLHILAERKNCAPFFHHLLEKRIVDLNVTNMIGQTPLHKAAAIDNWKVVSILLNVQEVIESRFLVKRRCMRVNLNARDISGHNPLGLAIIKGSSHSMFKLVEHTDAL